MKKILIISIMTIFTIPVFLSFGNTKSQDIIDILLRPEEQKHCGIPKLNPIERKNLNNVFYSLLNGLASRSKLEESAKLYLENEGWEEVEVIGTRAMEEGEKYLIVYCSPWTYILEPKTYSSLDPGKYLGQMSYTSCEIIDYDGDIVEFWTEDTE